MDGPTMEQRHALSGRAPIAVPGRVTVRVLEDDARFALRIGPEGREAAGRALGVALPDWIGGLRTVAGRTAIGLGPDEWAILAPAAEAEAVERDLAALAVAHSLVDTSHRDLGIAVDGPAAERMLSAACALDLSAMPAGSATRTIFDRAPIVLIKLAAGRYRIEVWQSFASHVWGLLEAVGREIALDI